MSHSKDKRRGSPATPSELSAALNRRTFLTGAASLLALPALAERQAQKVAGLPASLARIKPYLMAQVGHFKFVFAVAFSPDDSVVLTGSEDKTARLWETATGKALRLFQGHSFPVTSVAFSHDGRFVLTGSKDRTARLWEAATGREIRRFDGHSGFVMSVAFSPDGAAVLTGSKDSTARLWETATGREIRRFKGHTFYVNSVAFSSDGKFILTGAEDRTARLWETATGKEVRRFEGHGKAIWSVGFAPDGKFILTGSEDKTARLWETATGKEVRRFEGHSGGIPAVAFSSDGRSVLTGSRDKTARLWETATGKTVRTFQGHTGSVEGAVFSTDNRSVLTGSWDSSARLWETATGREIRRFEGTSFYVTSEAFSSDGKFIVIAGQDKTARLWDTATGKEIRRIKGHAGIIEAVAFSSDSRFILTGSADTTARLWETATGKELRRFEGHTDNVSSVAFSHDGGFVLTGSFDRTARLWETATGKEVRRFEGHAEDVNAVAVSQDGSMALTGSGVRSARLWAMATGKEIRRFEGHGEVVWSVAFSSDSRFVLTGSGDSTARLWDTATGKEIRRFEGHSNSVESVAFSSDDNQALTGSYDKTVRLWETATGKELRRFEGHSNNVETVAFSPDGKRVLSGSGDGTARLWEIATGRELYSLFSFQESGWAVLTPEGRFDTNNLEEIKALHWILPDAPMKPLPPEIFLRQYYEPRLFPRILAGETLPPIPDISSLNRVQPLVQIVAVKALPQDASRVEVSAEVSARQQTFVQNGKPVVRTGEVYDLRLFRDGQLVGFAPRMEGKVVTDPRTGKARCAFTVQLPRLADRQPVEFTAYAFNQDRVKSATGHFTYTPSKPLPAVKGRAYVISFGVNAYQDSQWNLQFAAEDARSLQQALCARLRQTGQFAEVVGIPLLSDYKTQGGRVLVTERSATKANFHAVLDILAGRKVPSAIRQALPNGGKLQKAQPEDLIVFSFSCHGEAGKQGSFYLFPYDIGPKQEGASADLYAHGISSSELSLWLREVDAGNMVMIVDACHSAASVDNGEFKPGPMGSRGLGQLAYDKGMRILAASQADDVAIENRQIRHGLLTYALLHDGLEAGQADWKPKDGRVELSEWLEYAEARVPRLYEEVKAGRLATFGTDVVARARPDVPANFRLRRRRFQQPSLFDFTKSARPVLVEKSP